jgi:hypothetical protein
MGKSFRDRFYGSERRKNQNVKEKRLRIFEMDSRDEDLNKILGSVGHKSKKNRKFLPWPKVDLIQENGQCEKGHIVPCLNRLWRKSNLQRCFTTLMISKSLGMRVWSCR